MLTILHSVGTWLPVTMTWLHTQIVSLPDEIESHILCQRPENLDQFAVPHIHSYSDNRLMQKLTDRLIPGLGVYRQKINFEKVVDRVQPDIWHSHFAHQAWNDRELVQRCGAKHILSVYGADISQGSHIEPWKSRIPEVLRQIDMVLCEGPAMASKVIALGCPADRVKIHHLGVLLDLLPFQPRQWTLGSTLKVLITGTFREKKGIPYALEALAILSKNNDLEITIIGDATAKPGDAEEKSRIMSILNKNNLAMKTRLLGFQPYSRLLEEALRHHIFLSPSVTAADGDDEGGSPVTITEMAASGMIIVSSRHCDIPEVIPDGIAGFLAEERDVEGLSQNLSWIVNNVDKWIEIQNSARHHIEKEYSALIQGFKLASIYNRLVG